MKLDAVLHTKWPYIIGVDEVGYGAWAGPVMVGAVVVERSWSDPRVRDSKVLSHETRQRLVLEVLRRPTILAQVVLAHDSAAIDRLRLGRARDELVVHAVRHCRALFPESLVVMDGNILPTGVEMPAMCLKKADALVPAVSAASIIAKECRDSYMRVAADDFPGYGFEQHMGYGGDRQHQHARAIIELGLCPIHRKSYPKLQELASGR